MSRLVWAEQEHKGDIDQAAIYPRVGPADTWDDLVWVNEHSVSIGDLVKHRDGTVYANRRAEKSFSATASCFTCPKAILKPRVAFGMAYRVKAEKLHLVYNATVVVGGRAFYQDDEEPFEVDLITTPLPMPFGLKPSAHLIVDAVLTPPATLTALDAILYGDESHEPRLPPPAELLELFQSA